MELLLKISRLIALLIGSAMVLIEIYSWKISKENFIADQDTNVQNFPREFKRKMKFETNENVNSIHI